MNAHVPLEGRIVTASPVHMPVDDYHAAAARPGTELVPVARHDQLVPAGVHIPAGAQVIVIHTTDSTTATPAAAAAERWTPGNVLALAIVAVVGIVALVMLAPLIAAMLQTLMIGAAVLAVLGVFLARALRPAPTPEPTKRRRGRRNR